MLAFIGIAALVVDRARRKAKRTKDEMEAKRRELVDRLNGGRADETE